MLIIKIIIGALILSGIVGLILFIYEIITAPTYPSNYDL
jgi:hypothetical protein